MLDPPDHELALPDELQVLHPLPVYLAAVLEEQ